MNYDEIKLNRDSPEPLHLQLIREMLHQLRKRHSGKGEKLISERQLGSLLGLNRATVHRVYAELLESGLVRRKADKSLEIVSRVRKKMKNPFPIIGIIMPMRFSEYVEINNQGSLQYLKGIYDRASEKKVSIITLNLPHPNVPANHINRLISEYSSRLTGIIHLGDREINPDPVLKTLFEYSGFPQVFITGFSPYRHIGSITPEPETGINQLIEYLKRHNINELAIISRYTHAEVHHKKYLYQYEAFSRYDKIMNTLTQNGMTVPEQYNFSGITREQIPDTIEKILKNGLPKAIICNNDFYAFVTACKLEEFGVKLPDDCIICGYDANIPDPRFISIGVPVYKIGAAAVDMVIDHFQNGISESNREYTLPTRLVTENKAISSINRGPVTNWHDFKCYTRR